MADVLFSAYTLLLRLFGFIPSFVNYLKSITCYIPPINYYAIGVSVLKFNR
ncbi:hypothetical protein Cal7507_4289 [Calothrix sp. PCC 7507]|nr:hypothetical protein Cal7507_4289 [Calothrix sp. PCC 7507]